MNKIFIFIIIIISNVLVACSSTNDTTDDSYIEESNTEEANTEEAEETFTVLSAKDYSVSADFYDNGSTTTLVVQGEIMSYIYEKVNANQKLSIILQLTLESGEIGSFIYYFDEYGVPYTSYYDSTTQQTTTLSGGNNTELIQIFFDNSIIDSSTATKLVVFIDEYDIITYTERFDSENISLIDGEYDGKTQEDVYEIIGLYADFYSDDFTVINICTTVTGYNAFINDDTYQLTEKNSTDEDIYLVMYGTSTSNSNNTIEFCIYENNTNNINLNIYEFGELVSNISLDYASIFDREYFSYDDNGELLTDPVEIIVENNSVKFIVEDKYKTDWIELSAENLSADSLVIEDIDITLIESGETYKLSLNTVSYDICEALYFYIFDDERNKIDNDIVFSSIDTENSSYISLVSTMIGNFTSSDTGKKIEFTETQIILDGEVIKTYNLDAFIATICTTGQFIIAEDYVNLYTFSVYPYDADMINAQTAIHCTMVVYNSNTADESLYDDEFSTDFYKY